MEWQEHIVTNDEVLLGKPVIKGTRLSVEHIVNLLASGWSEQQIIENHPRIEKKDLQAVFLYIQDILKDSLIFNEPQKTA